MKKYSKKQCESKIAKLNRDVYKWTKRLEDCKVELVKGKWYWNKSRSLLTVWNGGKDTYGFSNGLFWDKWAAFHPDRIPATEEEVKEALIKEAKRRGFKEGVKFKHNELAHESLKDDVYVIKDMVFDVFNNECLLLDDWEIFNNGKWAEIIEEPVYEYQWLVRHLEDESINASKKFYTTELELSRELCMSYYYIIKPILETKRIRQCNK